MGFYKRLTKVMNSVNDFGVNKVAPKVGKVINKGVKAAPKVIDKGAGVINKTINAGKTAGKYVSDGSLWKDTQEVAGKINRNVWTDESAYRKGLFGFETANKGLIGDDLNRRVKSAGDKIAGIYDSISKDTVKIGGNEIPNPMKLIKKDEESLIGIKATKRGALLAGATMIATGTPGAVKQYVSNRQGTNMDNQPITSAPRTPAYAQNAGATGDLVFALNNLRHGGMM